MVPTDPNQESINKYRVKAAGYDTSAELTMPLRRRTISLLQLLAGDTVLDVGAGTGLSYQQLCDGVGPTGRVLAVEQSPEMFALACQRVERYGWDNIWHVNEAAETVVLPALADAVLFNYTHDICRMPDAVDNLMRQLKPGARVAMAGIKFFPWWAGPLNLLAWLKNRPYNTHAADLWRPWSLVADYCDDFSWSTTQWGMGYIASGRRKAEPPQR